MPKQNQWFNIILALSCTGIVFYVWSIGEQEQQDPPLSAVIKGNKLEDIFLFRNGSEVSPNLKLFQTIFHVNHTIFGEQALWEEFPSHFHPTGAAEGDPLPGVAVFQNTFLAGATPLVYATESNFIYYATGCKCYPDEKHPILPASGLSAFKQYEIVELDTAFMIGQYWGESYYHGMIEDLPRLMYVKDLNVPTTTTILAMPGALTTQNRTQHFWNPYILESSTISWIPYQPQNTIYFVKRLIVPTGTPCGKVQSKPVQFVRERLSRHFQTNDTKPVILVQQRSHRGLRNHDELVRSLEERFAECCEIVVHHDHQDMEEYATLHHRATVVIGPHGAGFSNLIFTNINIIRGMIELHSTEGNLGPTKLPNPCHQITAKALGIPIVRFQIATDHSKFGQSFLANITQVIEWVDDIIILTTKNSNETDAS